MIILNSYTTKDSPHPTCVYKMHKTRTITCFCISYIDINIVTSKILYYQLVNLLNSKILFLNENNIYQYDKIELTLTHFDKQHHTGFYRGMHGQQIKHKICLKVLNVIYLAINLPFCKE